MKSIAKSATSCFPHYVGLDVHKASIVIAVARSDREPANVVATITHDSIKLIKKLDRLGADRKALKVCYEAGPTGYGLQRALDKAGIDCLVVAPNRIPRQTRDRVKTDKRDAAKLAQYLRSGDLTPIWIPDERSESLRDLFRARHQSKKIQRTVRLRLSHFLLRHQRCYPGKTNWTNMHLDWIRSQTFEQEAQNRVLRESLQCVEETTQRVDRLTNDIAELVEGWKLSPFVKALQALKGVRLVTAAGIAVEIGDIRRFATPSKLMSFLGMVPSEYSSGDNIRRGRITKTGNTLVRALLVEAAWSYRHSPKASACIRKRWEGLPPEITNIAWRAQDRLHKQYRRLQARGKQRNLVLVAIARQLVGFIWGIGDKLPRLAT